MRIYDRREVVQPVKSQQQFRGVSALLAATAAGLVRIGRRRDTLLFRNNSARYQSQDLICAGLALRLVCASVAIGQFVVLPNVPLVLGRKYAARAGQTPASGTVIF